VCIDAASIRFEESWQTNKIKTGKKMSAEKNREPVARGDDASQGLFFDPNLQIIFCVTLISILSVSSVTPAFPKTAQALGITYNQTGLLITAFTLPGVLLALFLGVLSDRWGRKTILIPSLILFGVAGGACAFVKNFQMLLLLRFIQGIGAAALGSLTTTLISDLYTGRRMTAAMGYNGSVLSVGTAAFPAVGGAAALIGWNWPFALSFVALPVALLVRLGLKNPEPKVRQELKQYLSHAFKSMGNRQVVGLFLASVTTFIITYGSYLTFLPKLMETGFQSSPFVIGVVISAGSVATALMSWQLANLTKFFSEKALLMAGFFCFAICMMMIPFLAKPWMLVIPSVIFGIGQGLNMPANYSMFAKLAPAEYHGAFMSLNGMVLRLGQTIGPPVIGLFYTYSGLSSTFFAGAGFAAVMLGLALVLIRE
jgi:MFS transporter, ACDE family, multidrug resistance protein